MTGQRILLAKLCSKLRFRSFGRGHANLGEWVKSWEREREGHTDERIGKGMRSGPLERKRLERKHTSTTPALTYSTLADDYCSCAALRNGERVIFISLSFTFWGPALQ
jgi:hypothetical protein